MKTARIEPQTGEVTEAEIKINPAWSMHEAWTECQKHFENPKRTAPANWGKYAPLSEILDTFVPILNKFGFSFRHDCQEGHVVAIVTYKDGAQFTASCPMKGEMKTMIEVGSSITYGRRYTCGMIFGVEGERDIDSGQSHAHEKKTYGENPISEAQVKRFWFNAKKPGLTEPLILAHLKSKFNLERIEDISRSQYNEIHDYFQKWTAR